MYTGMFGGEIYQGNSFFYVLSCFCDQRPWIPEGHWGGKDKQGLDNKNSHHNKKHALVYRSSRKSVVLDWVISRQFILEEWELNGSQDSKPKKHPPLLSSLRWYSERFFSQIW